MTAPDDIEPSPAAALVEEMTDIAIIEPVDDDAVLERAMIWLANRVIEARESGEQQHANTHLDTIDQLAASWELLDR